MQRCLLLGLELLESNGRDDILQGKKGWGLEDKSMKFLTREEKALAYKPNFGADGKEEIKASYK